MVFLDSRMIENLFYDKEILLPLDCKYIALWITKKKSEQLFVWTECDEFQFFEDDDDHIQMMTLFHTNFF